MTTERSSPTLTVVITGTNRGLGREFVRQYLADGHTVFALARRPWPGPPAFGSDPEAVSRLQGIDCDVTDPDSLRAAAVEVGRSGHRIDVLINNAGVAGAPESKLGEIDYDDMLRVFKVNTLGPLRVTERMLPHMAENGKVVLITSMMGSIEDNASGESWAYRTSKSALNMVGKNLAIALRDQHIATLLMHPGWVETDMGGEEAPLQPEESVSGMRAVIQELGMEDSGAFRDYSGARLPW